MSQIPQINPGAGPRPHSPIEDHKPTGKTSEEFTRLIEKVDESDAQKQGKRRERPKAEEEPEVEEEEQAEFALLDSEMAGPALDLNIPSSPLFDFGGADDLTGLQGISSTGGGAPVAIESWDQTASSSPSSSASAPSASSTTAATTPTPSSTPPSSSAAGGTQGPPAPQETPPSTAPKKRRVAAKAAPATPAPVSGAPAGAAPAKRKKRASPATQTVSKSVSKPAESPAARAQAPRQKKAEALKKEEGAAETVRKAAAKKAPAKGEAAQEQASQRVKRTEKATAEQQVQKEKVEAQQKAEKDLQAQREEAAETVAPGLSFLAEASLHHIATVPTAHGGRIEALSGRPLPTSPGAALPSIRDVRASTPSTLTRSQGIERVVAALKAAVLTLQEQPDKRTLTITLKGDPRLAGTALDGLKVVVEEYAAAPKQYNITLQGSPESQALLSGAASQMVEQMNRLGKERGWSVQRLDVQLGRPLFHRKEAGDMGQGGKGGHGGKTK